jgi:type IV secretion system protein VirB11
VSEAAKEKRFLDNLFADMEQLIPYLEDKKVTDVSVKDSGEIVVKKFGEGKIFTGLQADDAVVTRIILAAASLLGKKIDAAGGIPKLEGVIPRYNARITGILPPWTMRAQLTLRKPPEIIYTLENYVKSGRMTSEQYAVIISHLTGRRNVLIGGGTGSGKTTLLNAVLQKMCELTPDDDFYIVEDVPELQCRARLKTMICVKPDEALEALATALRWLPDRIIFGEVRYGEVMNVLLKAWNTGHTGNATTIHADSCESTLRRVRDLLREVIPGEIADITEAIHLCVHMQGTKEGPVMDEVYETQGKRSFKWHNSKRAA